MRDAKYIKNILYAGLGTGAAQIISLLASLLIARQYSPETFGTFSLILSAISSLVVISCLRLDLAILQAKTKIETSGLITLSLISIVVFSILFFIILEVSPYDLSRLEISVSTTGFCFTAAFQLASAIGLRESEFKQLNFAKTMRSGIQAALQISLPYVYSSSSLSLGLGYLISQIGAVIYLFIVYKMYSFKLYFSRAILIRYKQFIFFGTPTALLGALNMNLPSFIIPALASSSELGLFSMTMRFIGAPNIFISQAIAQAFAAKLNMEIRNNQNYQSTIIKTFDMLLIIITPLCIVVFLTSPYLFPIILGENWLNSGVFAQILTPWIALNFISSPMSAIAVALNKHSTSLKISVYEIIFRSAFTVFGFKFISIIAGITLYSISGIIVSLIYLYWIAKISDLPPKYFLNRIFVRAAIIIPLLVSVELINLGYEYQILLSLFIASCILTRDILYRRRNK